jgi:AcrR family transcriptional regulator
MEATRLEILRHAEDLFGHYGFSKTSMADIAGRAGMSPANLYRYYRNKQAIGVAVVEAFFRQAEQAILAALTGIDDPEARIRAIMRTFVQLLLGEMNRNPRIMELVDFIMASDEAWATLKAHIDWKRDRIEAELKRGVAAGQFADRPTRETAVNLMHAAKAFQIPQSLAHWREPETIMPELEGVLDIVFQGVRAR